MIENWLLITITYNEAKEMKVNVQKNAQMCKTRFNQSDESKKLFLNK